MAHHAYQNIICKLATPRFLCKQLVSRRFTACLHYNLTTSPVMLQKPCWSLMGWTGVYLSSKLSLQTASGLQCRTFFKWSSNHAVNYRSTSCVQAKTVASCRVSENQRQIPTCPRWKYSVRNITSDPRKQEARKKTTSLIYICAVGIFMIGASYAAVPLYRIFCQATGLGGQAVKGHDSQKVEDMMAVKDRVIKVRFNADVASSMQWNFRPQQTEIKLVPGETALAFYTAKNPTDKPIIGISTYNVIPFEAGPYFNKIQCFCFEEQRLNPHEQVDMPVFFFIDPEFAEDPKCAKVDMITLSYTFFEAKEGLELPYPGYATAVYSNQTPL